MRFGELVDVSRAVADTSGRLEKIDRLATLLNRLEPDEIDIAVGFLSGLPRQGRLGIGSAAVVAAREADPAAAPSLEVRDVDAVFARVAESSGSGAVAARSQLLRELFARATRDEQDFLVRLIFGELRQGALEGILVEAVARASGIPAARVRRAAMLAGALAPVARAALSSGTSGDDALAGFMVRLFQPVQPMLADSASDVGEALGELGEASLGYKLDGARIQVHKADDEVRVYSRNLRDVTAAGPEVVEIVRTLPAREIILDGEAIALKADGSPHPFQTTMRRFGRKLDVDALRTSLPITPVFFDALYLDGQPLLDEPLSRRVTAAVGVVPGEWLVPRIVTSQPDEADAFLARSIATGHEG